MATITLRRGFMLLSGMGTTVTFAFSVWLPGMTRHGGVRARWLLFTVPFDGAVLAWHRPKGDWVEIPKSGPLAGAAELGAKMRRTVEAKLVEAGLAMN